MLRRLLADSAGHFWWPAEFENVENPYFENIKNLKNLGSLSQTAPSNIISLVRSYGSYFGSTRYCGGDVPRQLTYKMVKPLLCGDETTYLLFSDPLIYA